MAISYMTQESEESKEQRPPVGKSSDTPKEVKIARREGLPPVIREARGYGAGCVYNHQSLPGYYAQVSKSTMSNRFYV